MLIMRNEKVESVVDMDCGGGRKKNHVEDGLPVMCIYMYIYRYGVKEQTKKSGKSQKYLTWISCVGVNGWEMTTVNLKD